MNRNQASQLNQSFMIHNMHLIRKTQQIMDYFVTVVSSLDNINAMIKSGNITNAEVTEHLDRIINEMDSVVVALRGRGTPPSKEDMLVYSGSFANPPKGMPSDKPTKEELEKEIKQVLESIFGKITKKIEDAVGDAVPPPTNEQPKRKNRAKKNPESDNSTDCPFDAEDLEDFLNGL